MRSSWKKGSRLGGEIDTLIKRIERALADENQEQA